MTSPRLKLYRAAQDCAAELLDEKEVKAIEDKKTEAFKASGFESKQDYAVFTAYFDSARNFMSGLLKLKLPSESASEKI
jgi:hypothetical protein